ncbi:MAG: 2-oxoacid:acceptor oxidoreductase family protein [Chloroflexi bacterium]|nr:2-oxoacid:acceptor oxidoreductase family protein [Chloroflexota bacterium]
MTRQEVRLAGFGGQGIILAGYLLGKAAALYGGQHAVLTQVYGPEARGSACNADVMLSDSPIDFPEVRHPSIMAVMSQEAAESFLPSLVGDGTLLFDSDLVQLDWPGRRFGVPATSIADQLGRRIVANMVMLGFLSATTGLVPPEALEEAIRTTVRAHTIELNLRAFEAGYTRGTAA